MEHIKKDKKRSAKVERQRLFLLELINHSGNRTAAMHQTGVPASTASRWFNNDQEFLDLLDEVFPRLELKLFELALKRAEESDTILIFLMKAANPKRFDEKYRAKLLEKELPIKMIEQMPLPTPIYQTVVQHVEDPDSSRRPANFDEYLKSC